MKAGDSKMGAGSQAGGATVLDVAQE